MESRSRVIVEVCGQCEKLHLTAFGKPACKAHKTKRDRLGQLVACAKSPARGLEVCLTHGAGSVNAKARSVQARRLYDQRQEIDKAIRLFGAPRQIDPAQGLIEEYWRSAGIVAALEQMVSGLDQDTLMWGVVSEDRKVTQTTAMLKDGDEVDFAPSIEAETKTKRAAMPNAWWKAFNEERDRFIKLGVSIVQLELEARRDEYIRAQVDVFASVLLDPTLGLSADQRAIAAAKLRALSTQAADRRMVEA